MAPSHFDETIQDQNKHQLLHRKASILTSLTNTIVPYWQLKEEERKISQF